MEPYAYGALVFLAIALIGYAFYQYWWKPHCGMGCATGLVCVNGVCATPTTYTPPTMMVR